MYVSILSISHFRELRSDLVGQREAVCLCKAFIFESALDTLFAVAHVHASAAKFARLVNHYAAFGVYDTQKFAF